MCTTRPARARPTADGNHDWPVLTELLDLLLPAGCGGCRAPGALWCARCAAGVGPGGAVVPGMAGLPRTVAAGRYDGPLRQALLAYKERGRRALAGTLAGMLADAALAGGLVGPRCWLVPAPSRPASARARGGDHMLAVVDALGERLAAPVRGPQHAAVPQHTAVPHHAAAPVRSVGVGPALRMRSGGRDSVGLDAAARTANLHGRILTRAEQLPPPGSDVVLVDDVVTTGATLRACASALAAAGVPVRGAVVLCDATGAHRQTRWSAGRPTR
jgi:predicted amidophosphoribosyltransferase